MRKVITKFAGVKPEDFSALAAFIDSPANVVTLLAYDSSSKRFYLDHQQVVHVLSCNKDERWLTVRFKVELEILETIATYVGPVTEITPECQSEKSSDRPSREYRLPRTFLQAVYDCLKLFPVEAADDEVPKLSADGKSITFGLRGA